MESSYTKGGDLGWDGELCGVLMNLDEFYGHEASRYSRRRRDMGKKCIHTMIPKRLFYLKQTPTRRRFHHDSLTVSLTHSILYKYCPRGL